VLLSRRQTSGLTTRRLAGALSMSVAFLLACDMPQTFRIETDPKAELTETAALDAARTALQRAGYDVNTLEPVCYRSGCSTPEKYFARNTIQPNRGYILWRFKDSTKTAFQLNVDLTKEGGQIVCEVGRTK